MCEVVKQVKAARRVSAPIVAIETADFAATQRAIVEACEVEKVDGEETKTPKLTWDIVRGLRGSNDEGRQVEAKFVQSTSSMRDDPTIGDPIAFVDLCMKFPPTTMVFMLAADDWVEDPAVSMGVWNLRDHFKSDKRTIILVGTKFVLPRKIERDVVNIREPLPTREQLRNIIDEQLTLVGLDEKADDDTRDRAVSAVQGLSAFGAEQSSAMSLTRDGINLDRLWTEKRSLIERTPGLKVWQGGDKFEDLGGLSNAKNFVGRVIDGKNRPDAIVWIDEIEKMFAGKGDTSGISQDFLGQTLSYMENANVSGFVFIGHPGTGKSAMAKAAGGEAGVPTIQLDMGAMKGSLVGESEKNLRTALDVISAVSNDNALWVATCNSRADMPPELLSRFGYGTVFFDLPDDEELASIWKLWLNNFKLKCKAPTTKDWTGREVRNCCKFADAMNCKVSEAMEYVVPYAVSDSGNVERLRGEASGRFLSASYSGPYIRDEERKEKATAKKGSRRRRVDLE